MRFFVKYYIYTTKNYDLNINGMLSLCKNFFQSVFMVKFAKKRAYYECKTYPTHSNR
jgi:hypothetical protein